MVFSSITFLFAFLAAVLLLYFVCPLKGKNWLLALSGLVFYAWGEPVTKTDLYLWGFNGTDGAAEHRRELLSKLGFPARMSTNALLGAINVLYNREEFTEWLNNWFPEEENEETKR